MKYLSLFSGIGGFEASLAEVFPRAKCIGFSEIDDDAIKVYSYHYPTHQNLGDVTQISNKRLKELLEQVNENERLLIVAGFPCKNLSSLSRIAGGDTGLDGKDSGLFFELLRIIRTSNKYLDGRFDFIIENNASMRNSDKDKITNYLRKEIVSGQKKKFGKDMLGLYISTINNNKFAVQSRNRVFWTTFAVQDPSEKRSLKVEQRWKDVLEKKKDVMERKLSAGMLATMNRRVKAKSCRTSKDKESSRLIICKSDDLFSWKYVDGNAEEYGSCKSRWELSRVSDTTNEKSARLFLLTNSYPIGKSRPICTDDKSVIVLDRRFGEPTQFLVRTFSLKELERLFGFDDGYVEDVFKGSKGSEKSKYHKCQRLLGNCVALFTIKYILKELKEC